MAFVSHLSSSLSLSHSRTVPLLEYLALPPLPLSSHPSSLTVGLSLSAIFSFMLNSTRDVVHHSRKVLYKLRFFLQTKEKFLYDICLTKINR